MAGVTLTKNADGTLTQNVPGAAPQIVIDPDGSYARSMDAQASTDPAVNPAGYAPSVIATPPPAPSENSGSRIPVGSRIPGGMLINGPAPAVASAPHAQLVPEPTLGGATPATGEKPRTAPEPLVQLMHGGDSKTESITSREHGTTTQGLDKASAARVGEAYGTAKADTNTAIETGKKALVDVAQSHALEASKEYVDAQAKQAGAMKAQDTYAQAYQQAVDERKQARNRKIDAGQAFADDKGAYAFLATMGAALANVGRAWMGQAMQPITVIDDLANRSVKLQLAQRESDATAAGETADQKLQFMLAAKSDAHEYAAQAIDAHKRFLTSMDQIKTADALAADQRAKADQLDIERAKALATTTAVHDANSRKTEIKTGPAVGGAQYVIPGSQEAQRDQKILHDAAAQAYPDLKPEERQKQIDEYSDKVQSHAEAMTALNNARSVIDAATNKGKENHVPGYGSGAWRPAMIAPDESVKVRQAFEPLVLAYEKAMGGSKMAPETRKTIRDNLLGGQDYQSMTRGLNWLQQQLDARDAAIRKQYPALSNASPYLGARQSNRDEQAGAGLAEQNAAVGAH